MSQEQVDRINREIREGGQILCQANTPRVHLRGGYGVAEGLLFWMPIELITGLTASLGSGPLPTCTRVMRWPTDADPILNIYFSVNRGGTQHDIDVSIDPLSESTYHLTITENTSRIIWEAFGSIAHTADGFDIDIFRRSGHASVCS